MKKILDQVPVLVCLKGDWILDLCFFSPLLVKEPGKLTCPLENQWLEDVFLIEIVPFFLGTC